MALTLRFGTDAEVRNDGGAAVLLRADALQVSVHVLDRRRQPRLVVDPVAVGWHRDRLLHVVNRFALPARLQDLGAQVLEKRPVGDQVGEIGRRLCPVRRTWKSIDSIRRSVPMIVSTRVSLRVLERGVAGRCRCRPRRGFVLRETERRSGCRCARDRARSARSCGRQA